MSVLFEECSVEAWEWSGCRVEVLDKGHHSLPFLNTASSNKMQLNITAHIPPASIFS